MNPNVPLIPPGSIKDLDRRLATVLTLGYEDLDTAASQVKLFDGFEGLLERPILSDELEAKYAQLLVSVKDDMRACKKIFQDNRVAVDTVSDTAPTFSNMPPVSGAIYWARSVKQRVDGPIAKLLFYNRVVF